MTNQKAEAKPAEEVKAPELDMFEKVKLMASMTSAVQNAELTGLIKSLPHGDKIHQILVEGVHREIQQIMGKSDKDTKDLSTNMQAMAVAMSKFVQIISEFNSGRMVSVLGAINNKLKPLGDLGQPQEFIDNAPQEVHNREEGPVYASEGRRAPREPGLGSF